MCNRKIGLMAWIVVLMVIFAIPAHAVVENQAPNTDIEVIPSDANALVLMDVGAESPVGVPGDVVTIVLPVAVNREYLPTERYLLRNITVQPNIPTDATVSNWPFDLINASYTRHLDDMSYNSTAEIYYDFRISQFATKGAYPVNFEVNATVWRMDDANGTTVTEDVTFDLCVYVTIMDNGSESGETTAFGPLQVSASNQSGAVSLPTAQPSQQVTIRVPVINKGGTLTDVTVTPVVSSSLDEFPFVAASTNYGKYFPDWEMGESNILEWTFQVSPYATDGNKVLTFRANYFENGESAECTFTSQISITNGYSAETEEAATAMSVMVTGYDLLVDGESVSTIVAGQDAVLRLTLRNNSSSDTAYKNVVNLSFANTTALGLSVGSSDSAYVGSIGPGRTATAQFNITAMYNAEVGPAVLGVNLAYENGDYVAGSATQSVMVPVSQRMELMAETPVVYGSPSTSSPTSISLNLINMGQARAMNVQILAEDGISMAESYYGGDILPGGTLTADIQVNCLQRGDFEGKLLVQYEDANGQQYTQEVLVPLSVSGRAAQVDTQQTEPPEDSGSSGSLWWLWVLLILLVLGGGGAAAFFLIRRKRRQREELYAEIDDIFDESHTDDGSKV